LGVKKSPLLIEAISVNPSELRSITSHINTLEALCLLPSSLTDLQDSQKCLFLGCLIGNTPIVSFYEIPKRANKSLLLPRGYKQGDHEEMTIEEFFARFNGRGIDFDHAYGYQCMDLAEEYNQDVIGAPRLGGNAIDVWTNFPANWYTRIENTPWNFPNEGDLILWNTNVGNGYGHIAVCQRADVDSFTSFDQNWPLGSFCHFQWHNYDNVLGWLRPN